MKNTLLITLLLSVTFSLWAQSPGGVNYQAIARDSNGEIMAGAGLDIRFSIFSGAGASVLVYQEVHTITTNQFGLFTSIIGYGTPQSGNFSEINWGSDEHHLQVELDDGNGYISMGIMPIMSVPYALFADKSMLNNAIDVDTSGLLNNQVLKWNGTSWIASDDLGSVFLSSLTDVDTTGIAVSAVLKWDGFNWVIGNDNIGGSGGVNTGITIVGDGTGGNPLELAQQSAINGQVLTWNGSSWVPSTPVDNNTTYIAGSGLTLVGTTFSNGAPDQTVVLTNGGNINIAGTYPTFTLTNTSPDQVVSLNNGGGISVGGAYPNFTITNTSPDQSVSLSNGGGMNISGAYPNFTITNAAPDQTLTLTGAGATMITGTYPNFTITSTDNNTTYTAGSGLNLTGTVFSNTAPDQTVTLSGAGATSITGAYPSFTITSTDNNTTYTAGTGLSLSGTVFSANTAAAVWNANQLQGNTLSSATPSSGEVLTWNGSQWEPQINYSSPWTVSGNDIYRNVGNVGIGLSNPQWILEVRDTAQRAVSVELLSDGVVGTTSSSLTGVIHGTGSLYNIGVFGAADSSASATGYNVAGYFRSEATTAENVYGVWGVSNGGASVRNYAVRGHSTISDATYNAGGLFATTASGTGNNYGVYAIAQNAGGGAAYAVYADGGTNADYAGYFVGDVHVTGTFTNPSDRRFKTNITPMESSLALINSLGTYTYEFNPSGGYEHMGLPKGKQFGFIAQEVERVIPELVQDNKVPKMKGVLEDEKVDQSPDTYYKSVNYIGLIPIMTKAIQEQQDIIGKQQKQIDELLQRVAELEKR